MLVHESPTGLRVRPTVTIRHVPGKVIRLPARAATILAIALVIWGALALFGVVAWTTAVIVVLLPGAALAGVVELQPLGKSPLAWGYVLLRHARRSPVLLADRIARTPYRTRPGSRQGGPA